MSAKQVFRPVRVIITIIIVLLLIALGYVAYVFIAYKRIPDNQELEVSDGTSTPVSTDTEYKMVSYNTGFGAYEPDFSFFMDGGSESWAFSKERLTKNMQAMTDYLSGLDTDILLLQEVDKNATRTYHVDETKYLKKAVQGNSVFAVNWDSSFLFYPVTQPHGKSLSGILTLSSFQIDNAVRRQIPVEDSAMKIVDLDRCYSKSYLPVAGTEKKLALYNVHMSAYTSDGTVADKQLEQLLADMEDEFAKGNYCISGGDLNKDLLGDSSEYFGIKGDQYSWAKPIKLEFFEGKHLQLICSGNAPSSRIADAPYNPQQFVALLDGFIVSDNVEVISKETIDTQFAYSDHNPITMQFKLKSEYAD